MSRSAQFCSATESLEKHVTNIEMTHVRDVDESLETTAMRASWETCPLLGPRLYAIYAISASQVGGSVTAYNWEYDEEMRFLFTPAKPGEQRTMTSHHITSRRPKKPLPVKLTTHNPPKHHQYSLGIIFDSILQSVFFTLTLVTTLIHSDNLISVALFGSR